MGLGLKIKSFFVGLFDKVKAAVMRAWDLAKPFLMDVLSKTAAAALASLQTLAIEAVKYVATQNLPTDEAKQKAFKEYMQEKSEGAIDQLKDYEINLLRETAVAIWKKANNQ